MPGWYLTHMDGRIMYVIAWNLLFNKQRQAEQHTGLSFIWNTSINHAGRGSWGKKLRFLCAWSSARQRVGHTPPASCTSLPPAGLFSCQQHTDCPALPTRSAGTGYQGYTAQGQKQKIPFVWSRGWSQHFLPMCSRRARSGLKYGLKSVQRFR